MLVPDSQGNIWKTNSCMCCRTAVSSFNNLLLSIKPASLHFGNAHLLNSKPTKLELSLNGNGIFSITLAKEIDGKSIQQMKSQRIRLTLLISFINWNRCVVRCHSHLENMAKQINSITVGKTTTLYGICILYQKLQIHGWSIMLGLEKHKVSSYGYVLLQEN